MKVVAIGGGEIGRPGFPVETTRIDEEIISLTGKANPRLLFLGTAMGDDPTYLEAVTRHFGDRLGCQVRPLALTQPVPAEEPVQALAWADAVYVGAGDTSTLLRTWRATGFDHQLRVAGEAGVVLAGLSAGAVCWLTYALSTTDAQAIDALGFIPGVVSPHFDTEPQRRPCAEAFVARSGIPVIGLDECAALVVHDTDWGILTSREGATATLLRRDGDRVASSMLRHDGHTYPLDDLRPPLGRAQRDTRA